MEKIVYPQYRKYKNNLSYFKIISKDAFEEIKFTGNKPQLSQFVAKTLIDRNYINDMLFDYKKNWEEILPNEYEQLLQDLI